MRLLGKYLIPRVPWRQLGCALLAPCVSELSENCAILRFTYTPSCSAISPPSALPSLEKSPNSSQSSSSEESRRSVSLATSSTRTLNGSLSQSSLCLQLSHTYSYMYHSINELSSVNLQFPIIADPTRHVRLTYSCIDGKVLIMILQIAALYDMLDEQDLTNVDAKGLVASSVHIECTR